MGPTLPVTLPEGRLPPSGRLSSHGQKTHFAAPPQRPLGSQGSPAAAVSPGQRRLSPPGGAVGGGAERGGLRGRGVRAGAGVVVGAWKGLRGLAQGAWPGSGTRARSGVRARGAGGEGDQIGASGQGSCPRAGGRDRPAVRPPLSPKSVRRSAGGPVSARVAAAVEAAAGLRGSLGHTRPPSQMFLSAATPHPAAAPSYGVVSVV
ncbi:PREDICTED: protein SPT2 homolog [Chinchilla lanigera]|uniref:protein SPT2 homolog n=1 Tax=Chinchilla lanigera TaxID=34839 RepID=UPI0006990954|nr:PREDICTED: protein SPT2 homolog [Chinchilla lanigera]